MKTIIIGSGISGISAGYHLNKNGEKVIIYEKDNDWGGLCGNFTIDGFRFDKFVHFTFADDKYIMKLFEESSPTYRHPPVSSNYYQGFWLKHPAQNNLAPLPSDEKVKIITDFISRPQCDITDIKNYDQWLRAQYGNYFAENYPFKYTRKYWGVNPKDLETKWVGNRMYSPDLSEMLKGAFETQDENFYYTKFMKYPKKGGFRSILNKCREGLDIRFNKKVVKINTNKHTIEFSDGTKDDYERLISSMPLPEIVKIIEECPEDVKNAASSLRYTSGYMVSLGFNRPDIAKYLWFYIYDEDILSARIYSPSMKSPDNVPKGCSSLQAEIFWANTTKKTDEKIVFDNTVNSLIKMGICEEKDIIVKDIRFEQYANVIFDKDIYKNRQIVLDFLSKRNIKSIGRFGKWDYLWTHQAFKTGMEII